MRTIDWDALPGLFPCFESPGRWLPLLQRHAAMVEEAAPRVRVSSVPPAEVVRRQYAESLELLRLAELAGRADCLVDVGSGGGFPGLVVAAVRPGMTVHLVEPLQKRAAFLVDATAALGLGNVLVHAQRAEEAGRGPLRDSSPLVMARAVGGLGELLEYTAPLAAPKGLIALPKGSSLAEEVAVAGPALEALNCEVAAIHRMRLDVSETLGVVVVRKAGPTPERYPRRPGMAAKRPLGGGNVPKNR